MISEEILLEWGAKAISFDKGEAIFRKGECPRNYYQVSQGRVKMVDIHGDGKEFIQGIFTKGKSFGEPPIFTEENYPADAYAIEKTVCYVIPKAYFLDQLEKNPSILMAFTKTLAQRLYLKAIVANGISSHSAEEALISLFDYLKEKECSSKEKFSFKLALTRQEIAGLTGMSVETVIRKVKELEALGKLKIENRKIFY